MASAFNPILTSLDYLRMFLFDLLEKFMFFAECAQKNVHKK